MFDLAKAVNGIKSYNGEPITIMEVCGTHTAEIIKNGIPSLLSDKIKLVAGPGCPVCVTVGEYADRLVELSMQNGITVASFGDMLRVPGSKGSLKDASARGGSVLMLYSPLELLDIAEKNKDEILKRRLTDWEAFEHISQGQKMGFYTNKTSRALEVFGYSKTPGYNSYKGKEWSVVIKENY